MLGGAWLIDTLRAVLVALVIVGVVWWIAMPRGWYQASTAAERRVIWIFLPLRFLLMPIAFHVVGLASARLFSAGTDADFYDASGRAFAQDLVGSLGVAQPGTGVMRLSVGVFYWLGGPDRLVATFLWAALGGVGLLLFWLATRDFVPSRKGLYSALVLLLPSLLFWSAGIGKEAFMMLGIGCLVMAFSQLHARGRPLPAALYAVAGVLITGLIRPHVTLILLVALAAGTLLLPPDSSKASLRMRLFAGAGIILLIMACIPLAIRLLALGPGESLLDVYYRHAENTANPGGRSVFEAYPVRELNDLPAALGTVLLRPWPWEAQTLPQWAVVAESLLMVGISIWTLVLIWTRRAGVVWSPMLVAALVYILLFTIAFSPYGNFGLLARERVQVTGFILVVLFSIRLVPKSRIPT